MFVCVCCVYRYTRQMHGIALQALHVQFLWQQPAASDCNQEWQHTLAHRCSLSSAVSSALCCLSCSLLHWSLSCRTASAHVLGMLSMMHTTARADGKELKALCKSRLATTVRWLCCLWLEALLWQIPQRPAITIPTLEQFTLYWCFRQPLRSVPLPRLDTGCQAAEPAHLDVLRKQYTHNYIQNCTVQAHKKLPSERMDYRNHYRDFSHIYTHNARDGSRSGSPQI